MLLNNWKEIKDKIYYEDGSLRDIYILNITEADWICWSNFVSTTYKVSFQNYETESSRNKIDFEDIIKYWSREYGYSSQATISLNHIHIKCYFFTPEEIENDIHPSEINTINDHEALINYMKNISILLNKSVILTPENERDNVLIFVRGQDIKINF